MDSVWSKTVHLPQFEALQESKKTDVLIIGGGMAGILCAYFLQEKGVDYMLVEGRRICSGVTKNTTAKITAQHGLIYGKLLQHEGAERARMYLEANLRAVEKYGQLCREIECDFEEKTSYIYSKDAPEKLEEEAEALHQIGYEAKIVEVPELPFWTAGAVAFAHQAQFHPLKFIAQIAKGLVIYENTFVTAVKDHTAVTEKGNITFEKVIFATHFPIDNKHGLYFMKMFQERSYVLALAGAAQVHGMYLDEAKGGYSFRNYQDLLLLGGGSHRTGKDGGKWQELRDFAKEHYPGAAEKYAWAAQDCMTLDQIPYIGMYSKGMPDYFVATGFCKWGMTTSMAAAMMVSELVVGNVPSCQEVFNPSRNMLKPQLAVNAGEYLANLIHFSKKRCPHLGCALKWNPEEHTWDCSCHGSRFQEDGTLLDNPATKDLQNTV